jgi:putative spermidine/putrescine transport system permease protein
MSGARWARIALRLGAGATLLFIYLPLGVILLYSFNASSLVRWPITDLTLDWYGKAFADAGIRKALIASLQAAIGATTLALILGTMIAFAVHRFRFFGRDTVSFLVLLPIALPGILTGIALNTTFRTFGLDFGLLTVIVGHATFCIVVVYNNVIARLRRTARSTQEASMDLGADTWQTFRFVTLPGLGTSLVAGGLLAFALSFDEIVVTTFTSGAGVQTLPIWIFSNYSRSQQLPLVNVASVLVLLLSVIPVYVAARITSDPAGVAGSRR